MILLYVTTLIGVLLNSGIRENTYINNKYINTILMILLFLIFAISINTITINDFVDLQNYSYHFYLLKNVSVSNVDFTFEPLFTLLMWSIVNVFGTFDVFLVIVWGIIFFNYSKAIRNLIDPNEVIFVVLSYVNYFLFFGYIFNVIRQGIAISFLVLALSTFSKNSTSKNSTFYISILIAPFFHTASIVPSLILFTLKLFNLKLKIIYNIWGIFIVIFVSQLNQHLFSWIPIDLIEIYSSNEIFKSYNQVNRLDFLFFSVFFGIVGIVINKVYDKGVDYQIILKCYLLFNSFFLAFGFVGYSDRIASFSWLLIPILLWKGISNTKNYRVKAFFLLLIFIVISLLTGSARTIVNILELNN